MPNEIDFSGIPALDDVEGLSNLINQNALDNYVVNDATPPLATPQPTPTVASNSTEGATQPTATPNPVPAQPAVTAPTYTSEQVQQILERNRQLEAYIQTRRQAQSAQPVQQSPVVQKLLNMGYSMEQINNAIARRQAQASNVNIQQAQIMQKLQNLEQYIQQQEYAKQEDAFIDKMTSFGEKFGLSEADLVTFGNTALSKGINLIDVTDVESVFRAIYPEQYAIRTQRMSNAPTSQIFGGMSGTETPRATASKLEDAYVDNFLKHSMPTLYGMKTK